ncbi:hypothetical protein [Haloplanus halobius]|uniref:hypothetical protein n=1 Tax=Haloplanus halobius TaxID=2934938 RepID=UPI00200EF49E|nr:hypothetical protein [Haloplanus sp. XH21]
MPAQSVLDGELPDPGERDDPDGGSCPSAPPATETQTDPLDGFLREYGVAIAGRELETALGSLDELMPAQRRTVARMADRIAAGVLAPARRAVDDDGSEAAPTVRRLFGPVEDVRDRR